MGKLKSYQKQFQSLLDKSIDNAEIRHKRMVTRPFDFAEKLEKEAKSYSFKSVRQAHNQYAKSLYSSLRTLNARANDYASDLIARIDKEAAKAGAESTSSNSKSRPAAKKTASRKTTTAKKTASSQNSSASTSTASA